MAHSNVEILIRVPRDLRKRLRIIAAEQEVSVNHLVTRLLAEGVGGAKVLPTESPISLHERIYRYLGKHPEGSATHTEVMKAFRASTKEVDAAMAILIQQSRAVVGTSTRRGAGKRARVYSVLNTPPPSPTPLQPLDEVRNRRLRQLLDEVRAETATEDPKEQ